MMETFAIPIHGISNRNFMFPQDISHSAMEVSGKY